MTENREKQEDLSGHSMGSCLLKKKIGNGAMGSVYLAEQKGLGRKVALKILDAKFSRDSSYISRFEGEAKSAAQLTHPNIVQVYDFGHEGDRYYIISEFVEGGTVQILLEKEKFLSPEKAVDLTLQAAHGLKAAHAAKIIHRDIKPDNLMLTPAGVLKIADFGLAKVMEADAAATQSGMIMGTPFYMSPEQARGQTMDSRSDIYSLGITLYCMVIGELPFDADSVIGVLLKQISADRPDPCAINPSLPPVLGALIMRMMDRSPENRPQNPDELIQELETVNQILKPVGPPPDLAEAMVVSDEQRSLFKPLASSRIIRINRIDASSDMLTRMITSLPGDGGALIETPQPLPANTAVEIRFTVPGKEGEFSGIGLVRWASDSAMGVTFIKVQMVKQANKRGVSEVRLSGPMAINALTATPIHQRLLRYVYSNAGQKVEVNQVAGALGVGVKMIEDPLSTFERASMIQRLPDGKIELKWPQDKALQEEIVVWVGRHGLKG